MTGVTQAYRNLLTIDCLSLARCPSGFGPPGPNPPMNMDSPTELSENIILNVLVEIATTLRFSAY